VSLDAALFDVDDREPAIGPHVLMPNMSYGCGGSILTKQGGFVVGAAGDNWPRVGCPECRAIGQDALLAEQAEQQGRQEAAS
jgi:hypothetical protein